MKKSIKNLVVFTLLLTIALASSVSGEPNASPVFKQEELEQLVAPIALYPDNLLSQILMASTYPLEVTHADKWVKQNKELDADALDRKTWDPSVKALVNFPRILTMMSEKLDWTQKLGDAFLAQQKDVMNAVQKLRNKAYEKGSLKTTEEQVVKSESPIVTIESADQSVVYVPAYCSPDAYGEWPYSDYPPYDYCGDDDDGGLYYGNGWYGPGSRFVLGAAWGYARGNADWNEGDIGIDTQSGREKWQHDPAGRRGVPYRDQATAQKFNRASTADAVKSREAYRGRAEQGRQEVGQRGSSQARDRAAASNISSRSSYDRGSAFQGMDRGSSARNYSNRGYASRQGMSRPSGGGMRGGGRR